MKATRTIGDLVRFLFNESQLEELKLELETTPLLVTEDSQERLSTKKTPLSSILGDLGLGTPNLIVEVGTLAIEFDDQQEYNAALAKLSEPDSLYRLAEAGWSVTNAGEITSTTEQPRFKIRFIELYEPDDHPDRRNLETLARQATEFAFERTQWGKPAKRSKK